MTTDLLKKALPKRPWIQRVAGVSETNGGLHKNCHEAKASAVSETNGGLHKNCHEAEASAVSETNGGLHKNCHEAEASAASETNGGLHKNCHEESASGDIHLLHSPALDELDWLTHAFTTRLGGNSREPYDSFNLGRSVGNQTDWDDALRNRHHLCRVLGISSSRMVVPGQVHSKNVVVINDADSIPDLKEVDGLVTRLKDTPLLLHFADCVPVIIVDSAEKMVAICHAGWRGTARSICVEAVQTMKKLGGESRNMIAAIGPAIGSCCYPCGDEVATALKETIGDHRELIGEVRGQPSPDLKSINALQLLASGVAEVDISDWCTACNPEIFYSHRQSGGVTGRQGALVSIN